MDNSITPQKNTRGEKVVRHNKMLIRGFILIPITSSGTFSFITKHIILWINPVYLPRLHRTSVLVQEYLQKPV